MATQPIAHRTGILSSIGEAWSRYRKRRAVASELRALGSAELERLVHDAGLTFSDLVDLTRHSGESATLLYQRLERAGIDHRMIEAAVLRDLQRCCTLCESKAQCAHEIEDKPKAANWPEYCPNRQTIEALSTVRCH